MTPDNMAFGIFYICLIFGGFAVLGGVTAAVMFILERIPPIKRRLDAWYDTLPMSDPDW